MIVCILGLALHVFNKAVKSDFSSPSSNGKHHSVSSAAAGGGRSSEFSLPLLSDNNSDDDFSSDEEELFTAGGGGLQQNGGGGASRSGYRAMADDFYLKDNRQWTGVRELHLQRAEEQLDVNNTGQAVPDVLLDKENKEAPPSPLLNIGTTE